MWVVSGWVTKISPGAHDCFAVVAARQVCISDTQICVWIIGRQNHDREESKGLQKGAQCTVHCTHVSSSILRVRAIGYPRRFIVPLWAGYCLIFSTCLIMNAVKKTCPLATRAHNTEWNGIGTHTFTLGQVWERFGRQRVAVYHQWPANSGFEPLTISVTVTYFTWSPSFAQTEVQLWLWRYFLEPLIGESLRRSECFVAHWKLVTKI